MKLSAFSAIELQSYIEDVRDTNLAVALKEVQRLQTLCQDIIEVIATEYAQGADGDDCLEKIDDIAHQYFIPEKAND